MGKNLIAYGGGILAFAVVFLLLKRVVEELFLSGSRKKKVQAQPLNKISSGEKYLPLILPVALACVLSAVYAIILSYLHGGQFSVSRVGIFRLFSLPETVSLSDIRVRLLWLLSVFFYVGGSILIFYVTKEYAHSDFSKDQSRKAAEAGIRASVFFCIAPFSVLAVRPAPYAAAVFFLLLAYYAYQKEHTVPALFCLSAAVIADGICLLPILAVAAIPFFGGEHAEKRKKGLLFVCVGVSVFLLKEIVFTFLFRSPLGLADRIGRPMFLAELLLFCFPVYVYAARKIRREKYFTVLWTVEGILCGFFLTALAVFSV